MANKEIQKPNDMFVSTLTNGNVDTMEFLKNGINAGNTQFLDPEFYKETPLVKKAFTDKDGNFRDDLFKQAYLTAAKQYQDLAEMNTYKKLEDYVEYNAKDIFAPLTSKKSDKGYEISPELNPQRKSKGVSSLFEWGDSNYSMRELAQMSKIWDSENQVWMDKTAQDRGVLGSLFGQSLVYATYDEDTDTIDPITGRKVHHKKGEWKLNDKGQYYTETIGNRSGYGKQFVAASDTLTKEGSALNKIDFFDSDDLDKSAVGTVMKTVTKIAPYLIPEFNLYWGGATASIEMAKVLPTFAKMIEGIAIGGDSDNETAFTRSMNSWENYFSKFDKSYSDKGMQSNWGAEKMLDQVSDIFAQLYQMRAAASLSRLAIKDPTKQAMKEFSDKYMPEVRRAALKPGSGIDLTDKGTMQLIISTAMQKMPSMKKALDALTKLSKALSVGYMALSSSADVYADALDGGFDRRMAGFAGLTAALGLYGIMMVEDTLNLGGWFLDSKVGYHEGVQRATMMKALKPYYKEIADAMDKISDSATKEEKVGIIQKTLGKILPKIKNARLGVDDGAKYLKNGMTEAIQEMTEEAVMDASKGIYDFLSWAGIGSNRDASFGVVQDFASGSFLERYLQNAVGGFMGGMLFEFQLHKIEPFMEHVLLGKAMPDDVKVSLVHEIANGHTADLYKALDEMAELDSDVSAFSFNIDGQDVNTSANGNETRGQAVSRILKQYIQTLEGALIDENANLTDDQLLIKSVRDIAAIKALENCGTDKLLISDFTKLAAQIADIKANIDQSDKETTDKKLTEEQKKEIEESSKKAKDEVKEFGDSTDWKGKSIPFLKELLKQKRQQLESFLKGEKAEEYLYKTLVLSTPEIRSAIGGLQKSDYAYLKYGVEYKDLTADKGSLNQKRITEEWEEWNKTSDINDKLIKFGAEAYKDFDKRFSKYILDYDKNGYGSVRQKALSLLLSSGNITLNEYINDNSSYEHIKLIANYLKGQEGDNTKHTGDVTLNDIFSQDELLLKEEVKKIFDKNPEVVKMFNALGIERSAIDEAVVKTLAAELGQINVDTLSGTTLAALTRGYLHYIIKEALDARLKENPNQTLGEVITHLKSKGIIVDSVDQAISGQSDTIAISDFLTNLYQLHGLDDISVGLGTSLLNKYLTSETVIDDEVRKRITEEALNSILRNLSLNIDDIRTALNSLVALENEMTGEVISLQVTPDDLNNLINTINESFDGDQNIKDIVDGWISELIKPIIAQIQALDSGDKQFYSKISGLDINNITEDRLSSEISKIIMPFITEDVLYKQYIEAAKKEVKQNSIYDSLENIASVFTEGGLFKVLEILKQQHSLLRAAERFENYLPQLETEAQLEAALRAIQIYKALVQGMSDKEVSIGSPFAINQQMKRFKELNKISSDSKYETIDSLNSELIYQDLLIKEQEIKGYLQFKERAYLNKTGQDLIIKKSYCQKMIDKINKLAVSFALEDGGFSILPPENEREKATPEETLAYLQHYIYNKFHSHFKTAKSKGEAISRLIKQLNLDKNSISRSSRPTSLTQEIKGLSDYDLVQWIATSLGADSHEFYYRYNDKILNNKESKIVPFFSLETSALQAWSFAKDQNTVELDGEKMSVHSAVLKELFKINPDIEAVPVELMFFINGITGAGKSTVVGAILSVLLGDKKQYITAPNVKLIDNYNSMIETYHTPKEELEHGSIYTLFSKVFGQGGATKVYGQCKDICKVKDVNEFYKVHETDSLFKEKKVKSGILQILEESKLENFVKKNINISELPEVVFVDEATQISQPQLQVLNWIGKKYGIKIILSGDSVQRGAVFDGDPLAFNDLFMYRSAKLNISIRSANNLISMNNLMFNKLLEIYENKVITDPSHANAQFAGELLNPNNQIRISYFQDEHTFNGYKFVQDLKDFRSDIELIAKLNKEENNKPDAKKMPVMVITELNDQNTGPINPELETLLKDCGLVGSDIEYYSAADINPKAVQGSEARYVIVDNKAITLDPKQNPGEVLRSVYTFASRAQRGALFALSQDRLTMLEILQKIGVRNGKDSYTQKDEVAQLAKVDEVKATRIEQTKSILGDWKPEKLGIDSLEVVENKDGTKSYIRIGGNKQPTTSKTSTSISKSENNTNQPIDANAEADMSNEDLEKLIDLTNSIPEKQHSNGDPSGTPNKGFTPKSTKGKDTDSVAMWAAMDVINVPPKQGSNGLYEHADNGINFNMDGLFDPKRVIYPHLILGLTRFKHLLLAAKNKEDIVMGIKADNYIGIFLAEAVPSIAFSKNKTDFSDWKTSSTLCDIYSEWFRDSVEIDDKYYIFGKSLRWDPDQGVYTDVPYNIAEQDINKSVGPNGTALYFGIHLKDKSGLINQYFSLGAMSKLTLEDGTRLQSDLIATLYDQADKALQNITDPDKKFVAYKLNDSTLFDLNMSSTMWIREVDSNRFESITEMRKRGFDFDTKHMYYVDSDKVLVHGEYHYKMLVFMAKKGVTSADINERFEEKKYSFEERLKELEKQYVDNNGNLRIAGSYWTHARYINASAIGNDNIDSKAYNRIIFLNGKEISASDVFESLRFDKANTSKEDREVRRKLSSCSPASQTLLITDLLALVGAFRDTQLLRKYIIGWRNQFNKSINNGFTHDKDTLDSLLEFVEDRISKQEPVSAEEFKELLTSLKHRILFYPFFVKYVFSINDGASYRIVDARKFDLTERITGVPILEIDPKEKASKSQNIDMDKLHDSVAYPVLAKNKERIDVKDEFDLNFSAEGCESEDFGMFQINFDEEKLPSNIGVYGVLLLDPMWQIKNSVLGSVNTDSDGNYVAEDSLELILPRKEIDDTTGLEYWIDQRYPERKAYEELPKKTTDFNPDNFHPTSLTLDDFVIDADFIKYVNPKETKATTKTTGKKYRRVSSSKYAALRQKGIKWDPKTNTRMRYNSKQKRLEYYSSSLHKWLPSKMSFAEFRSLKGFETKVTSPKTWDGKYTLKSKGKSAIVLNLVNDLGWEVRPGDYVLLNGETGMCFYVYGIDRSNGKSDLILSHYSNEGKPESKIVMTPYGLKKHCSVQDVTAVVKRTIPSKNNVYTKNDVYITGLFKEKSKFETGKYNQLFKTPETFIEMAEGVRDGLKIKSLDFEKYFYVAVPVKTGEETITLSDGSTLLNYELLYDPLRPNDLTVNIPGLDQTLETNRSPITIGNADLLLLCLSDLRNPDLNTDVSGITLFSIIRKPNVSPTQLISESNFFLRLRELISEGKTGYIAHQILFDESAVNMGNNSSNKSFVLDVDYVISNIIPKLSTPEELIVTDSSGNLDLSKMANIEQKVVTLSENEYKATTEQKGKYPLKQWLHIRRVDSAGDVWYDMIPTPDFYFRKDALSELKTRFDKVINRNFLAPESKLQYWENNLKSVVFLDRQADAYDIVKEFNKNGEQRDSTEVTNERQAKELQRSILDLHTSSAKPMVIISVLYDAKSKEIRLGYLPEGNYDSVYDPKIIKYIPLLEFISQIGSRFKLTGKRKQLVILPVLPKSGTDFTSNDITTESVISDNSNLHSSQSKDSQVFNLDNLIFNKDDVTNFVNKQYPDLEDNKKNAIIDTMEKIRSNCSLINSDNSFDLIKIDGNLLQKWYNIFQNSTGSLLITNILSREPESIAELTALHGISLSTSDKLTNPKVLKAINQSIQNENVEEILKSDAYNIVDKNTKLIGC